jgi:hypothetical protein
MGIVPRYHRGFRALGHQHRRGNTSEDSCTPRQQKLILSANNKDNITLEVDGSARINDLHTGAMRFTSAPSPPNYMSEKGHVVWNENPSVGGPLGWICLGAANWGNFGIID